jgi:hypothetical protein
LFKCNFGFSGVHNFLIIAFIILNSFFRGQI